jgi:hypothetical protein
MDFSALTALKAALQAIGSPITDTTPLTSLAAQTPMTSTGLGKCVIAHGALENRHLL